MIGENQCKHGQLARSYEICELERENERLRAQLARCVQALETYRKSFEDGFASSILDSLPEQAKADAEVLRCAEQMHVLLGAAECPQCNGDGAYYDRYGDVCQCQWCDETEKVLTKMKAVQAAKEEP